MSWLTGAYVTQTFSMYRVSLLSCPRARHLYRIERRLPPGRPVETAALVGRHSRILADSHRPLICCGNHEPVCCACHVARTDDTFLSSVSGWKTVRLSPVIRVLCASRWKDSTVRFIRNGHGLLYFKFWLASSSVKGSFRAVDAISSLPVYICYSVIPHWPHVYNAI